MKSFRNKWNFKAVEDDGAYMSKEAKSFVTAFRNMLKRELSKDGIEVVSVKPGHYDLYGFVKKGERYIYVSYSIPRHGARINFNADGCVNGVLYRTAKNEKDYTGEMNNFCSIQELPNAISSLFEREERRAA